MLALGSFALDQQAQSLVRSGSVSPLRPKAWQVLMYLAERSGVVVSGSELFDHVWADVAVTPKTLTNLDTRSDTETYGPFAEALEELVSQADIVPLLEAISNDEPAPASRTP